MHYSVDSVHLHPYIKSYQFFFLFVELVFLIFTIVFVFRTLRDMLSFGVAFYTSVRCWIDLGFAASSTFLITMFIWYNIELYNTADEVETMPFHNLFHLHRLLLAACGFVGLFAILRALLLCRYIPAMHRLIVIMRQAASLIVSIVFFGLLVWLMIATCTSALYGYELINFRSVSASLTSTLYTLARVNHFDSLHVSYPLSASIFIMIFVLFFICVVQGLCVIALFASFRDVRQLADPEETQLFFGQLAQNFRDAMSCASIGVTRKTKKKTAAKIL